MGNVVWEHPVGFWAVTKPAGIPVFPPHRERDGACVLRSLVAPRVFTPSFAGGLAHRLDIPTSGLLLGARDGVALGTLRAAFSSKELEKTYLFLTAKRVPWTTHSTTAPLAHDRRRKSRMVVQRGNNTPHRGKWLDAETHFEQLARVQGGLSLWKATMRTGVMHQIRLHAASVGLALHGDQLYGGGAPRPLGWPVPFALHHAQVRHQGWQTPTLAPPAWWGLPEG